jgi:hypothetical protein
MYEESRNANPLIRSRTDRPPCYRCATRSGPINRSNANWLTSSKQAATLKRLTQSRLTQNMPFRLQQSGTYRLLQPDTNAVTLTLGYQATRTVGLIN